MAAFHERFWQDPGLGSMDWLQTRFSSTRDHDGEIASFRKASDVFVDRFGADLSTEQIRVIGNAAPEYPRQKTAVVSPPLTLSHGDWTTAVSSGENRKTMRI